MKINFRVTVGSGSITATTKNLIEQASKALYTAKAVKKT